MFFAVRSNDSFNFPLGWIKYIVVVVVVVESQQHVSLDVYGSWCESALPRQRVSWWTWAGERMQCSLCRCGQRHPIECVRAQLLFFFLVCVCVCRCRQDAVWECSLLLYAPRCSACSNWRVHLGPWVAMTYPLAVSASPNPAGPFASFSDLRHRGRVFFWEIWWPIVLTFLH